MGSMSEVKDQNSSSFSVISLQELVKEPKPSIPRRYVRLSSDEQEPDPSPILIPTIDMNQLVYGDDEIVDVDQLDKLHSICKEWGIFQLVNHGVSSSVLEKLKEEIEEFFKLPVEEKMKYKVREDESEGYGNTVRVGGSFDWCDRFFMFINPIHKRKPHLFPELPSSMRNALESYFLELEKLAAKLLSLMSRALKIDRKELIEFFEDGLRSTRMTYYPPCPNPEMVMGLTPHSDATLLTILNQINGVDGFQIKKDGVWFPVGFHPHALVINVGDILEIYSNGVYRSIEHRALPNTEKERISMAYFLLPKLEAEIGPSTSLNNPHTNPPLFKRIGTEQYVKGLFLRKLDGKSYLQFMRINQNDEQHNSAN